MNGREARVPLDFFDELALAQFSTTIEDTARLAYEIDRCGRSSSNDVGIFDVRVLKFFGAQAR